MNTQDDDTLIRQYRSGNAAAFDSLYQRYRLGLYNYISRQVYSQSVCDDIYQDVWFKVIHGLDQFQLGQYFPAWLFKIARNRLIDYWRQNQPDQIDNEADISSDQSLPEKMHFIEQCIERLKALLISLKPEQRDAFVLQQESGMTLEQIAEISHCGRETIKSRLRYAIQKLRKGLEGCDE